MKFRAHIDQLAPMLAFIRAEGARAGLDSKSLHQFELASEEGITNIIRHAFLGEDQGEVEVVCRPTEEGGFCVTLKDEGTAVNPLEASPPVDPNTPPSERSLGGLGVFLMQNLMDEVAYERLEGANILTLLKRR